MKYLFIIGYMFWCCLAIAQTKKCKDVINQTDRLYQNGQIQEAVKLCEPCIRSLKSQEERFEAYRLMGICHLFLNNKRKAYQYASYMVQQRPDYAKYPGIDPSEFTQLINNFEVREILFGGIKTGLNFATPTVLNNYSQFNAPSTYYLTTGYQLGIFGEYKLESNMAIGTDLLFQGAGVKQYITDAGGYNQDYKENIQSVVFLPYTQFYLNLRNNLRLYSGIGTGFGFIVSANGTLQTQNNLSKITRITSKDMLAEHNRVQWLSSIKLGIGYPIGRGYMQFECAYVIYYRNLENADKRYSNMKFILDNQYVNDDVRLSMILFNISYSMPILSTIINHNR